MPKAIQRGRLIKHTGSTGRANAGATAARRSRIARVQGICSTTRLLAGSGNALAPPSLTRCVTRQPRPMIKRLDEVEERGCA